MIQLKEGLLSKANIKNISQNIDFSKGVYGIDAPMSSVQKFIEKKINNIKVQLKDGFVLYFTDKEGEEAVDDFCTSNYNDGLIAVYDFSDAGTVTGETEKEFMKWIKKQTEESILFYRWFEM